MEVRYTPGDGVLVARGERWLLLGAPHEQALTAVLDQLWDDLGQPAASALALATVRRHLAGSPIAWLDAVTGEHVADGGAAVERHGDRWELTIGPSPAGASLRLVEGVVAAGALQVTGAIPVTDDVATPTGAVIDGIPAEILSAEQPTRPAPAADASLSEALPPEALPLEERRSRPPHPEAFPGRYRGGLS